MDDFVIFGQLGQSQTYEVGHCIFQQADSSQAFYWVKSGLVKLVVASEDGKEKRLRVCESGEIFGTDSFFSGNKQLYSALVAYTAEIVTVDAALFKYCCEKKGSLVYEVLEHQACDTRNMMLHAWGAAFVPAETRVVDTILKIIDQGRAERRSAGCYVISGTQEYLAEYLGVSRVTVGRALKRLRSAGVLETDYSHISVLDVPALRSWGKK